MNFNDLEASISTLDALDLAYLSNQLGLNTTDPAVIQAHLYGASLQNQQQPGPSWPLLPMPSSGAASLHRHGLPTIPLMSPNDPAAVADLALRLQSLQFQQQQQQQQGPGAPPGLYAPSPQGQQQYLFPGAQTASGQNLMAKAAQARERERLRRSTAPTAPNMYGASGSLFSPGWLPPNLGSPSSFLDPTAQASLQGPRLPPNLRAAGPPSSPGTSSPHSRPSSKPSPKQTATIGPSPTPRRARLSRASDSNAPPTAPPAAASAASAAPSAAAAAVPPSSRDAAEVDRPASKEDDDRSDDEGQGRGKRRRRRGRVRGLFRLLPEDDPEFCDWEWWDEDEPEEGEPRVPEGPLPYSRVKLDDYIWYPVFQDPSISALLRSAIFDPSSTPLVQVTKSVPLPPSLTNPALFAHVQGPPAGLEGSGKGQGQTQGQERPTDEVYHPPRDISSIPEGDREGQDPGSGAPSHASPSSPSTTTTQGGSEDGRAEGGSPQRDAPPATQPAAGMH